MKKINYFGKEYTVSDDVKWMATSSRGNVFTFTEEPEIYRDTWVVGVGTRIDICGAATADWKNSLRKVEDIIVVEGHPHADLMLKYAMIAQYDDKPWENFEFKNTYTDNWMKLVNHPCWDAENEYRLEPKIQIGQIWIDSNGYEVEVTNVVDDEPVTTIHELGGNSIYWTFSRNEFLQNFKRRG